LISYRGYATLRLLLVNPPIYDFAAFDFWLRPYGMMRVAGQMPDSCELSFYDFLVVPKRDAWGRGQFMCADAPKPALWRDIPRRFHRYGKPRAEFQDFLRAYSFDFVLIQTQMTYWYPGVREVIEDVRKLQPSATIILGGVYATLCSSHARSLGADVVIEGAALDPLWKSLSIAPRPGIPYWPSEYADIGIIKITEGCPFRCTYCSAPLLWPGFAQRPLADCLDEFNHLAAMGAKNIAFYDDALLYRADRILIPFLEAVIESKVQVSFHTPNALNAPFMTATLARLMVRAGFASFFFGLESHDSSWQRSTGAKIAPDEFADAVHYLRAAGAQSIVAYIIVGHPDQDKQDLESTMRFAHRCGAKVLLSEFSPIPGTVDGQKCDRWVDLSEPLSHNKTAFTIRRLGAEYLNHLKHLSHSLNSQLKFA
jgi:pyruvate-formate lyase-activating enzyme